MSTFESEYGVDATSWTGTALTRDEVEARAVVESLLADMMNKRAVYEAERDAIDDHFKRQISKMEAERDRQLAEIRRKIDGAESVALRCSNTLANFETDTDAAPDAGEDDETSEPATTEPPPIPAFLRQPVNSVQDALVAAVDDINSQNEGA